MHLQYILTSKFGTLTKRAVHSRRLVHYHTFSSIIPVVMSSLNVITMVGVSRPLHDNISANVGSMRMSDLFHAITTEVNERQVPAYFLVHICLCFQKLPRRWIDPEHYCFWKISYIFLTKQTWCPHPSASVELAILHILYHIDIPPDLLPTDNVAISDEGDDESSCLSWTRGCVNTNYGNFNFFSFFSIFVSFISLFSGEIFVTVAQRGV